MGDGYRAATETPARLADLLVGDQETVLALGLCAISDRIRRASELLSALRGPDITFDPDALRRAGEALAALPPTNPVARPVAWTPVEPEFRTDIHDCARCGTYHGRLGFRRLRYPAGEYTHWATCPDSGEPVLLLSVADAEESPSAPKPHREPTDG